MYEAMARRYRPRTFDDVIGQEHVAQTLKNAIATERVAHAYLFCGPHGCGKTSMARIFACALVCEKGPTATPCGECAICRDVLRGQDLDVQEIDGASNNGVEQVRALREQAGYIPTRARYKVYIIDEVHMLSVAAFNALLKTLEEPPAHVKFILATTDPHKILGTILSRCQRFDFRLVPPPRLAEFFKKLVTQENAEITADALDAVAAFSGGSVRDGLVLLDQLLSYAQGKVTREDVERVRGVAGAEAVAGIFEAVLAHDVKKALGIVDEVAQRGTNVGDFLDQLIEYGRDLMLVSATGTREGITAYGPARKVLFEIADAITLEQSLLMLDVFAQARTRVRSRALTNPLVPLEMAVARLAGLEALEPVSKLMARLDAYASGAPLPTGAPRAMTPAQPVSNPSAAPVAPVAPAAPAAPVALETMPSPPANSVSPATQSMPVQTPAADTSAYATSGTRDLSGHTPVAPAASLQTEAAKAPVSAQDRPPWEAAPDSAEASMLASEGSAGAEGQKNAGCTPAAVGPADSAEISSQPVEPLANSGLPITGGDDACDPEEDGGEEDAGGYFAEDDDEPVAPEPVAGKQAALTDSAALLSPAEAWDRIRARLAEQSPAENSMLADVTPASITHDTLYLSIPPAAAFFAESLNDPARKRRLESCAQEVLGRAVRVQYAQQKEQATATPRANPAQERHNIGRNPGVRLVVDLFDGTIVNVEEGH